MDTYLGPLLEDVSQLQLDTNISAFIHATLRANLQGREDGPPWNRLGYCRSVLPTIQEHLKSYGITTLPLRSVEQFYCSQRSVVYRISLPNDTRSLFFKDVDCHNKEVLNLTCLLRIMGAHFPGYVCAIPSLSVIFMYGFGRSFSELSFVPLAKTPVIGYENKSDVSKIIFEKWVYSAKFRLVCRRSHCWRPPLLLPRMDEK